MDTTRQRIAMSILGILAVAVPTLTLLALDDDSETAAQIDTTGGDAGTEGAAGFSLEPADGADVPAVDAIAVPTPTTDPRNDILTLIEGDERLGEARELLARSGLADALDGDGPFTVLVPLSTSYDELTMPSVDGPATGDEGLEDRPAAAETIDVLSDPDHLIAVAAYHIIGGNLSVEDLTRAAERGSRTARVPTLQGESIELTESAEGLLLDGRVLVSEGDLEATNGTVHLIDELLVPLGIQLDALVAARPISFEPANSNFTEDTVAVLDRIAELLADTDVSVAIHGHTDDEGDPIQNQNLSQSRARAVLNYLVGKGIDEARLSAQGFGPSQPIANNATDEGRAQNRRIEFLVD